MDRVELLEAAWRRRCWSKRASSTWPRVRGNGRDCRVSRKRRIALGDSILNCRLHQTQEKKPCTYGGAQGFPAPTLSSETYVDRMRSRYPPDH